MGTRGTFGFVIAGDEKLAYNHWDSYPSGLGVDTLKFLRETDVDALKERAGHLLLVDPESTPSKEERQHLAKYSNLSVSEQTDEDWYCLLRENQGNYEETLEAGVMIDGSDFPLDSLFCEWAYIIDLDHEMLEVYKGFQNEPHKAGRFAERASEGRDAYGGAKYYPVALVAAYPLRELPSDEDFVAQCDPPEED